MMKHFFLLIFTCISCTLLAQDEKNSPPIIDSTKLNLQTKDSVLKTNKQELKNDSAKPKIHSPRKAAIRSAILPGLGQAYNKKYWKIPLVYTALGITGSIFVYNLTQYKDTRFAYKVKYNMRQPGATAADSALFNLIKPQLRPISEESLRFYRGQFRKSIDYSAIFFVLAWGLNVVDAAVDAHLKGFDVSPNLSFKIKPGHSDLAGTNGLSLVLAVGKTNYKRVLSTFK